MSILQKLLTVKAHRAKKLLLPRCRDIKEKFTRANSRSNSRTCSRSLTQPHITPSMRKHSACDVILHSPHCLPNFIFSWESQSERIRRDIRGEWKTVNTEDRSCKGQSGEKGEIENRVKPQGCDVWKVYEIYTKGWQLANWSGQVKLIVCESQTQSCTSLWDKRKTISGFRISFFLQMPI